MRAIRLLSWCGAALATLAVLFATAPRGPGLTPDGMSYLAAAQSFAHGGPLREPFASWSSPDSTSRLADYPAGFSIVLAAPMALGVSPPQAARWVEALSMGLAVAITIHLLGTLAGIWGAAAGFSLVLLMPAFTDISVLVVSEPLFFVIMLGCVATMVRRPDRPLVAGLLAAAANLVRYAGTFLVAGVVIWSGLQPGSWRWRMVRMAVAAAPGLLLHAFWRVAGIDPGGGLTSSAYGGVGDAIREGWHTGVAWLAPGLAGAAQTVVTLVFLAGLVVALGIGYRRSAGEARRLYQVCGVLAVLYVGTVGFARLYVIPDIPFDSRILSPFFLTVSLAAAQAVVVVGAAARTRVVTALAVSAWCALAGVRDAQVVRQARASGLDYETAEWQESPVADWLRGPGRALTLYTTDPAGIWFINGRPSRLLPDTLDADSVSAFRRQFESRPSALVAFDVPFSEMAPADSIVAALRLTPAAQFAHGVVWVGRQDAKSPSRQVAKAGLTNVAS
ncbi:MAG TPA: hypothetical protein VJN62_11605 [Gemmatimonadales bacterium]|nr:hypothetical protein [Gemmatimonadales bacterium]